MIGEQATGLLRELGRAIKAECPPGVGFALFVEGLYLSTANRDDVRKLVAEWLVQAPATQRSSEQPREGESGAEHAARLELERWCASMAQKILFDARALILFAFDFEPGRLAWRAFGDQTLVIRMLREFVAGTMS